MSRHTRRGLILGGGVLVAVPLAACGGTSAPAAVDAEKTPASLTLAWPGAVPPNVLDYATGFTEQYPALKLNVAPVAQTSWGDFFEKVGAMIAAGTPPDMGRIPIEGIQLMAHKGTILPLDAYIKRDEKGPLLREYFPDTTKQLLSGFAYWGKQYSLPWSISIHVVWYNTKLFREHGISRPKDDWTVDDFEKIARQLTNDAAGVWGYRTPVGLIGGICPWLYLNGTDILTDDWKQSRANDPRTIEAIERYQSFSTKLRVAPPNAGNADWVSGKLAMQGVGGAFGRTSIRDGMRDFDVLPHPKWRTQTHVYGGAGFEIFKGTKSVEQAWVMAKWSIQKDVIVKYGLPSFPARRSVAYESWVRTGDPPEHFKLLFDVVDRGAKPVVSPPEYNEIETATNKHVRTVLNNEASVQSAMANLHRELTEILARRTPPVT